MILPTEVSIEHVPVVVAASVEKLFLRSIYRIPDSPNIPKSGIYFDFARCSKF